MSQEDQNTQQDNNTSPSSTTDEPVDDVDNLKVQLAEATARAELNLANWQRSQADFVNFRRRTEQERGESTKFSNALLILNILPALDDLERALYSIPREVAGLTWMEGIHLIYRKLQAVLENAGLSEIDTAGEKFDPNRHEAIMYGEGEEGTVIS
ncbi:MAG: nucleotide exchange factor GrpE, partial [Dehalococcoidia bacterium]|nr:nucleotide exchange factor GrpE [Dehalococcoidia bacterium]